MAGHTTGDSFRIYSNGVAAQGTRGSTLGKVTLEAPAGSQVRKVSNQGRHGKQGRAGPNTRHTHTYTQ